jgi:hypothetical protein
MERVTVDSNNKIISKEPLPNITRTLSQVISDPDVQAYLTLKQTLVKKWLDEDVASAIALEAASSPSPTEPDTTPAP